MDKEKIQKSTIKALKEACQECDIKFELVNEILNMEKEHSSMIRRIGLHNKIKFLVKDYVNKNNIIDTLDNR